MQNYRTGQDSRPETHSDAIGHLARLDELSDYKVADDDPDVHGWAVKTSDGLVAGRVDELIVDTDSMKVRYLDVELDSSSLNLSEERHVLIPIASAHLDEASDDVLLESTVSELKTLPPYQPGSDIAPGASHAAPREEDTARFYGKRGGTGGVKRTTLSEEEARINKQERQVGTVDVKKSVDTQRVSKEVPVTREEVTVERRPISGDAERSAGPISEDEVARVPLMEEQATVEKHTVPKEEVVVSKKRVQDEQRVEADLKKEHLDVKKPKSTR